VVATDLKSPVAWAPVSQVPHRDGSVGHFPHIIERGKPGIIGVLANGKRFVNEAHGYYDYVSAMVAAVPQDEACVRGWSATIGSCAATGWATPARAVAGGAAWRSGYLKQGATLEALADACGIDPAVTRHRRRLQQHARNVARTRCPAAAPRRSTASRATRSTKGPTLAWRPSSMGRSMR
jgi:hypothetical protein